MQIDKTVEFSPCVFVLSIYIVYSIWTRIFISVINMHKRLMPCAYFLWLLEALRRPLGWTSKGYQTASWLSASYYCVAGSTTSPICIMHTYEWGMNGHLINIQYLYEAFTYAALYLPACNISFSSVLSYFMTEVACPWRQQACWGPQAEEMKKNNAQCRDPVFDQLLSTHHDFPPSDPSCQMCFETRGWREQSSYQVLS